MPKNQKPALTIDPKVPGDQELSITAGHLRSLGLASKCELEKETPDGSIVKVKASILRGKVSAPEAVSSGSESSDAGDRAAKIIEDAKTDAAKIIEDAKTEATKIEKDAAASTEGKK